MTVYGNELYHYGVIGMRWGHHKAKYDEKAEYHARKFDTAKTKLGKNYHNYRAYRNEYKSNVASSVQKDRGNALRQFSNLYGTGDTASAAKAAANYYDRKKSMSKTRLRKTINESRAFNMKVTARTASKAHNAKNAKEWGKAFVDDAIAERRSWSGRSTSGAKELVIAGLTQGWGNLALDTIHYLDTRK